MEILQYFLIYKKETGRKETKITWFSLENGIHKFFFPILCIFSVIKKNTCLLALYLRSLRVPHIVSIFKNRNNFIDNLEHVFKVNLHFKYSLKYSCEKFKATELFLRIFSTLDWPVSQTYVYHLFKIKSGLR